jgi:hypothetical protein
LSVRKEIFWVIVNLQPKRQIWIGLGAKQYLWEQMLAKKSRVDEHPDTNIRILAKSHLTFIGIIRGPCSNLCCWSRGARLPTHTTNHTSHISLHIQSVNFYIAPNHMSTSFDNSITRTDHGHVTSPS